MFKKAVPIFAENKAEELNYQLILRQEITSLKSAVLHITAFSFYRLFVNGEFVAFGPSRAAYGYSRVDKIDLSAYHTDSGNNLIEIHVAGYYCGSLATANRPSFVTAELRVEDEVLFYTGRDFSAYRMTQRVQKTERYSCQRHFGEVWDMRNPLYEDNDRVNVEVSANVDKYLESTPPLEYTRVKSKEVASIGRFEYDSTLPVRKNRYSWAFIDKEWGRFDEEEIPYLPYRWIQAQKTEMLSGQADYPITLGAGEYAIIDMGKLYAGFITMSADILSESDVVIGFSELSPTDKFEFSNINMQNVIEYIFPEGSRQNVISFEPYTCKVAIVMVKSGAISLSSFGVITYQHDSARVIKRKLKDPVMQRIYDSAVRTFQHNATDLFMDCPSRERAGWLGDPYFSGKAEYFITGESRIESAFLENYRLYTNKGGLPDGVLPECYPSDFEGNFIPQFNLWFIMETYEHLTCRGNIEDAPLFKKTIYEILNYFKQFENSDGLLECLPSWNFVEWSRANEWVRDISYPTNFLYSAAMRATGELYADASLLEKAQKLAELTRQKSFNGEVFIDNAVYDDDGVARNTDNVSEVEQYYAVMFGGVDIFDEKYSKLKEHIFNRFSAFDPNAKNFVPANVFLGKLLRICLCIDLGRKDLLRDMLLESFADMADLTDTLWEYNTDQRKGSYDHGFSALAAIAAVISD